MKRKTKTTVAVIGAAGAVVIGAVFLTRAEGGSTGNRESESTCGKPGAARVDAKLANGTVHAAMSSAAVLRGSGDVQAAFELVTGRVVDSVRPPLDLAFVIDHSGSMGDGRLDHAKSAARGIVDHLGAQDRVALIQYDDSAQVVVASLAMDDAGKMKMRNAIDALYLGGGTNLHDGLVLGRDEVKHAYKQGEVSRVILLSDGKANVGITATPQIADAAREGANQGVRISAVGIGLDFNEDLMEAIAEAGRGTYAYVKEAHDLDKVIADELAGVQATVATNVELRLRPACTGAHIVAVHGYESHTDGGDVVVPMADLFGGDDRKLVVSMKVPAEQPGHVGALHAEIVYRSANGGELKRQPIDLGVEVVTDASVATASVDQSVMAQVLELKAAESMRQAATAYEHGETDRAVQILDSAQREIQDKGAMYKLSPKATAPSISGLGDMSKKAKAYKPDSYEGKDMLKTSKQKARVMSKQAAKPEP